MNVPGLPVTVVLNREGDEIARLLGGADWASASARAILAALIAAPMPPDADPPATIHTLFPSKIR